MRSGRIDIHGHLLPGVDDGCKSVEESLRCARFLVAAGYTHAFCTPHVWPTLPHNNVAKIAARVEQLQQELNARQIPLRLIPGGEINILWGWPALGDIPGGQVVTYGLEGRYALFDFWAETMNQCIPCVEPAIKHLQSLGLILILAHPERIAALHDPQSLDWFKDRGVLLQMNTWCLTDPPGVPTRDTAERLLREDRYFLFGTDLHDWASMPNRIRGLDVARQIVGSSKVDQITRENPKTLLSEAGWSRWHAVSANVS